VPTADPLEAIVDTDRYPIADLADPRTQAAIATARASLAARGVAALEGFLRADAVAEIAAGAEALRPDAHLEDIWGTPYLGLPDESFPEGHPQRTSVLSRTWVLAYDLVPRHNPARVLYEDERLIPFLRAVLADVLGGRALHRMADPLGALNLTLMDATHVQGWHYDSTDFVVSIAVRSSEAGGEFECARDIRTADEEHYDDVARVLSSTTGDGPTLAPCDLVEVYPMVPGTLMVFMGRYSIHRVAPVHGDTARIVALFGYDTKPDTHSSDLLKLVRYGRTEARSAAS
jgi:hypothetical protein